MMSMCSQLGACRVEIRYDRFDKGRNMAGRSAVAASGAELRRSTAGRSAVAASGADLRRNMAGRSAVAASGADSTEEVQTLSIRLPNGELRSCQVPSGTPIESITEIFEKEIPPYHEAKLCVRDEILCGIVADALEGEVTLVKMPSIKKAFVVLQRLHREANRETYDIFQEFETMWLTPEAYHELLQVLAFIAQYEDSLEKAHAQILLETVYNMYVNAWETKVDTHSRRSFLARLPDFYLHMEMVFRLLGRFGDLRDAQILEDDLQHFATVPGTWGDETYFRTHCVKALEQIRARDARNENGPFECKATGDDDDDDAS